jgi:hypothetical protein
VWFIIFLSSVEQPVGAAQIISFCCSSVYIAIYCISPAMERMIRHENKSMPAPIPRMKIVEAYGLLKCPKLVQQVAGDDLEVRNNALAVLSEEFLNPYEIEGCARAGIIPILASMVVDSDFNTRLLSSKALAIAALDANGISAIVGDDIIVADILLGMRDPSEVVRGNIYDCIRNVTKTAKGVDVCCAAGVCTAFVQALTQEPDHLKSAVLCSISNIVSAKEDGLVDALAANVVSICIQHLHCPIDDVRWEAAKVFGFVCYDEDAKTEALDNRVVEILLELFIEDITEDGPRHNQPIFVLAAATMALMAVTSTDEGKRRVFTCMENGNAVMHIAALLYLENRSIRLNTMKVISNIAVFPPLRRRLLDEASVLLNLKRLRDSGDVLLEKHAKIAIAAVNWEP